MKKSQVMIGRYKANARNAKKYQNIFQSQKTVDYSDSIGKPADQSANIFNQHSAVAATQNFSQLSARS